MAYYEKIEDIDDMIKKHLNQDFLVGFGVVIKNHSDYDLEYVNSGLETGCSAKPILNMFFEKEGEVGKIKKGYAGGLMLNWHRGGEFGMFYNCSRNFSNCEFFKLFDFDILLQIISPESVTVSSLNSFPL